jgi:hypothetical protein
MKKYNIFKFTNLKRYHYYIKAVKIAIELNLNAYRAGHNHKGLNYDCI